MRRLTLALAVSVAIASAPAWAQTSTPTETPTPTDTPTPTNTATPTISRHMALATQETCASTPCNLGAVPAGGGQKTIVVNTTTGTATVLAFCRNPAAPAHLPSEVQIASLTGATCTTQANCLATFAYWCDEIFLRITACGSNCRVNAWLRRDPQG